MCGHIRAGMAMGHESFQPQLKQVSEATGGGEKRLHWVPDSRKRSQLRNQREPDGEETRREKFPCVREERVSRRRVFFL